MNQPSESPTPAGAGPSGVPGVPIPNPPPPVSADFPELSGFRLIQELARSPRGVIFKARRLVEQDIVAVKIFRKQIARETGFRQRLMAQAEASFALEHPGLVRSLGCVEEEGRLALIMDYVRGEALSRALQRNVRFSPPRAIALALRIAEALRYAARSHRFHGRLHPGDLIVTEDSAHLTGLGLGDQPEHPDWQTRDPHLFEPLMYAATEVLPSKDFPAGDDERRAADLYSLGAVLFHMLTGSPPFRGTDEDALKAERASLAPVGVRWPQEATRALPPKVIALVERLLSPTPADRGGYEELITSLREALAESEGRNYAGVARAGVSANIPVALPPVPLLPVEVPNTAPKKAVVDIPPANSATAQAPANMPTWTPPPPQPAVTRAPQQRLDSSSRALIVAVVVVLAFALGLASRTLWMHLSTLENKAAQNTPQTPVQPTNPQLPPPITTIQVPPTLTPAAMATENERKAAERLTYFKELMQKGTAKPNHASLRILNEIQQLAGEGTRTAEETRYLKAEIEETMARGGVDPTPATAERKPAPNSPTAAEEKVFQEILTQNKGLLDDQRFGVAIQKLKELPVALKLAPFPERAEEEIKKIETSAKTYFADQSLLAEKALTDGDFARARGIYQTIQARIGITSWEETAAARVKAIDEAEVNSRQKKEAADGQQRRLKELSELAVVIKSTVHKTFKFQYATSKEEVEKVAKTLQDPDVKKMADSYLKVLQDEEWIFARGRARLKERIAKDPNRSSPLQVFNSERKDAPGQDITDFDANGFMITSGKGGATATRLQEWKGVHPSQPYLMLTLVLDTPTAQEHLCLSSMAFHRELKTGLDARDLKANQPAAGGAPLPLPEGLTTPKAPKPDPKNAADKVDLKELIAFSEEMRKSCDEQLDAAQRTDGLMREQVAAQKTLYDIVRQLMFGPEGKP